MVTTQELLDQGVLIDPELVKQGIPQEQLDAAVREHGDDLLVVDQELLDNLQTVKKPKEEGGNVEVVWSYEEKPRKRTYDHFVKALQIRYRAIERMLKQRQELSTTTSVSRIQAKKDRERVSFIAMVVEKNETANKNYIFTVEDMSGQIKVLVTQKDKDLFELAKDVQLDEVIGITGMGAGEIVFADQLLYPDIPLTKELKKAPKEEYAIFIGDPHFGSKVFLKEDFERMLLWLNGKTGNEEQKRIASKVKYVVFTGDLVEGVGVYPGQEHDLEIEDITEQYEECVRWLKRIPEHMQIIIYTGNHDAGRLSEPQEPLLKEFAQPLYDLPNTTIVSNPGMVNIAATDSFPGLDCLLYHGGSLIYYADNIPSVRAAGGQKRVDLIMKYLLQRRHLAPTHNAAMTIPTTDKDWLLIDKVPDLFITGHIHRPSVSTYRNVTCINSGCWTETTEDQVKRGLEPQPAKLPILNLKTRQAKVMNFKKEPSKAISRGSDQEK